MGSTQGPNTNFTPPIHAKSNADDNADIVLWASPTTHRLLVDANFDSVSYIDDADWTDGVSENILIGGLYQSTPQAITDGDVGPIQVDENGNIKVVFGVPVQAVSNGVEIDSILSMPGRRDDAFQAIYNSADASTAASVKAATAAKSIYITDIVISVGSAMNVTMQDNAGTPIVAIEPLYMPANSVWSKTWKTPIKLATNVALMVKASTSGNISVTATGYVI